MTTTSAAAVGCCSAPPCGAVASIAEFGVKPVRVAARMAATETQYRGEAEFSQMHLTCICAAERAQVDVRPGLFCEAGLRSRKVLWLGEGPKPEKRSHRLRHRGHVFFWLLFFARTKKSSLPWVNHPQA